MMGAAVVTSDETARLTRLHNDSNVLALGGRTAPDMNGAAAEVIVTGEGERVTCSPTQHRDLFEAVTRARESGANGLVRRQRPLSRDVCLVARLDPRPAVRTHLDRDAGRHHAADPCDHRLPLPALDHREELSVLMGLWGRVFVGVLGLSLLQWTAGGLEAPYEPMVLLLVLYVAAIHPPRRTAAARPRSGWHGGTRRRADEASWRHAAGVRPTISATSANGYRAHSDGDILRGQVSFDYVVAPGTRVSRLKRPATVPVPQ